MSTANESENFLTPTEDAILRRYFGVPLNASQEELDLWEGDPSNPDEGIHLEHGLDSRDNEDRAIANAVARLLLAAVQDRLPNWAAVKSDGEVVTTREKRTYGESRIGFFPIRLFTINWADSGPGFSWPEEYRVIWVPGFDRYVVTASRDTAEGYGYADEAIGDFSKDADLKDGSLDVIKSHWEDQYFQCEQHRWAYIFDEGLITTAEAEKLADEVWETDNPEDEEDEADEEEAEGEDQEKVTSSNEEVVEVNRHAVSVSSVIENPIVLRVSKHLSCTISYDDLIKQYCALGSAKISIGYSYVTGLGQMYHTGGIAKCAPEYCKRFYEDNGYLPMGVHEIPGKIAQTPHVFKFKFPDTAPIVANGSNLRILTGPATYFERDWYLHGMKVHRINPDDSPEVILRAPIRDELDARAVSLAIEFALNSRRIPRAHRAGLAGGLAKFGDWVQKSAYEILVKEGYPPNLAELWRRAPESKKELKEVVEAYAEILSR